MQEVDERVRYLRLLEPSRLGALCKDFLDDEVLAEMIVAVQAHLAANDVRIPVCCIGSCSLQARALGWPWFGPVRARTAQCASAMHCKQTRDRT